MEVSRKPGAAQRVSARRLVCLLVCLPSDFNPAWRGEKTAHYGETEILAERQDIDEATERQTVAAPGGRGRR